jgi:hypothetical protein
MVFGSVLSSALGNLSHQKALELANIYLDHVEKTRDADIVMVLCHDTEASLHQARKTARHNKTMQHKTATVYIRLGRVLAIQRYPKQAQAFYSKAEKLG